jgi:CheY-like chemotaxis protein
VFNNATAALRYLHKEVDGSAGKTYIILLDIYMPDMDGWQFLEEYLHLPPETREVIQLYMHSSSISPADQRKALTLNQVKDYIAKPLVGGDLKQLLSDLFS